MATRCLMHRAWSSRLGPAWIVAGGLLGLILAIPLSPARSAGALQAKTEPTPEDEERVEQREAARRIMRDNCLICHSEEMVAGQRLTAAQWKTEVEKMIGWGAPVPADQTALLTAFLTEQYSDAVPAPAPSRLTYEQALATVRAESSHEASRNDAGSGAKLYATHCATCHGADGQGADLGPNLLEIATLLRPAEYHAVVRDGRHRMPGFKLQLTAAQENDILTWLSRQRYRRPEPNAAAPGK